MIPTPGTTYQFMQEAIQNSITFKKEKIEGVYGKEFAETIGMDILCNLPKASTDELNLKDVPAEFFYNGLQSSHFKGQGAIAGMDDSMCAFIAMRVEVLDQNKKNIIELIEVIYKKPGVNYWTSSKVQWINGKFCSSLFHSGRFKDQLIKIGNLLKRQTIEVNLKTESDQTPKYLRLASQT
ncbi:MAG: hypothetical protein K1000chlam2_00502 [Chlamydiae bacterium]|nr:hypothetical protein [Chlamydiota bacterium]